MIIGPGEPRRPQAPAKGAKKAKAKKRRRAEREAAEVAAAPEESATPELAATPEPPTTPELPTTPEPPPTPVEAEVAAEERADPATGVVDGAGPGPVPAPGPSALHANVAPAADAPLADRIDGLRGRVDELLALVDAATATREPLRGDADLPGSAIAREPALASRPDPGSGDEPRTPDAAAAVRASVETADDRDGAAWTPDVRRPRVETADDRGAADVAPRPASPPSSAVLVARELLAGGMPTERVRVRLQDAYGVADPDAVLAGVGDR